MPKTKKPSRPPPLVLLQQYTPLVYKIAGGFRRKLPRHVLREDLIAAGMGGLWDAIVRNAGGFGESFEWYLRVRIRGAILDELRAQDWRPRRARAAAEAASGTDAYVPPPAVVRFDDMSDAEQNRALHYAANSEAVVSLREQLATVQHAIDLLPTRERRIIIRHYFYGEKFKDMGKKMSVSEPRVSQLHARAMDRLRNVLIGTPMPPKRKR